MLVAKYWHCFFLLRSREERASKQSKIVGFGRRSCVRHGRSPKGARNCAGLYVKATKVQAKVQSGRKIHTDWTSKLRQARKKSTRPRKITTLHTKSSPPPEVPSTIISSPSYPSSISFTCREYVKRYEEATGADRLHILNRTIEDIRKKMYMK